MNYYEAKKTNYEKNVNIMRSEVKIISQQVSLSDEKCKLKEKKQVYWRKSITENVN